MQVVTDSLLTEYRQEGKGKTNILLVHGWADDLNTFKSLEGELKDEYRLTAVDLPGFGKTQPPEIVWGLQEYAQFLSDFLSKIKLRPDVVIAHSNGAAVVIKAVADKLIEPRKLVLLSAAGIRDRQKLRKLGLKITAKVGKAATFWLPQSKKKYLQKKLYGAAGSDMLVAPHLQETFKKTVAEDVQHQAAKITLPTLLVYGDKDRATPVEYGQAYNKIMANSKLEVVEGADHFAHQARANEVASTIKDFLK